ncbi:hypothetical protein EDC04DRAFT_2634728 [Pisolithus marmoratus]|nr:hypothetical protein EDC04DRAFT_2634728 [Pisolithus marmoratus]
MGMLGADVNSSPVKGKAKDDGRWRSNWWDFRPLVDDIQRPVAWSTSSVIFTAHSSQPLLLGRLFPSSKQFMVPSPEPILRSPSSFEPPSVISVAPSDQWLFAFYPGLEGDGIACLWKRGYQVDSWTVKECWPMAPGAGVITATWAGVEREWITYSDGSCSRLPLRGPLTPVSSPTLLLVTQSHELHVCYARPYSPSLSFLCCSLVQPYFITEGQSRAAFHDVPSGPRASRLCIKAAIGFMYTDSSVLVAMRSRRYPTTDSLAPIARNGGDLGLSLDVSHQATSEEPSPPLDWGALAEEQTIELCEVKLRFDGSAISLMSYPLTPIYHSSLHLTNLAFTCTPPPKPDPSASPKSSPRKDKQPARPIPESAAVYLIASFFDFDDYNSIPKSEIASYSMSRIPPSPLVKFSWSIRQIGERSFPPRVILSFAPEWPSYNPRKPCVVVMLADIAGSKSRGGSKAKEVPVGLFTVLQLPDLSDDEGWDHPRIMSPVSRAGTDWPVSLTMSVNCTLLCAVSVARTSIHSLPRPCTSNADLTAPGPLSPLAMILTSALVSRKSIADIAHILCLPSTPMESVIETFSGLLLAQEANARAGSVASFTFMEVIGAELEVYKARAASTTDENVKEYLTSLWKNAHNICSVASTLSAFEDCKDQEGYDLDVVWQLVSLSEWAVAFLENIMKECLLLSDMTDFTSKDTQLKPEPVDDNPFFSESVLLTDTISPFDNPALLHLVHPLLLENLIDMTSHVNQFYQWLNSMTAKAESAQMARDAVLDVVDYSGLNFEALEGIFKNVLKEVRTMPGEQLRPSLARCHPVPAQHYELQKIVQTLSSSAAINKPRLFIKPSDLVDGFTNLSISTPWKEQGKDVVTKGQLLRRNIGITCLRCGQESEVGGEVEVPARILSMWRSWESMWMTRCVCGGLWVGGSI